MHRVQLSGASKILHIGCRITLSVFLSVFSLFPRVMLAECLWPDFPDEPLADGDTVTCTGMTGTFVSHATGVTINVLSGAVINTLQLGPANHARNFGEIHTMLFNGPDFTADNFGTVKNSADATEYTPGGAIVTYVNGPGTINNSVFVPDPYDPAASVGEIDTSGDYMAGIFVRDPTDYIDITNDMAYGFDPVLDPDTGEQIVDDQGNPVYEEVIRGQGSITTSGIGAHGIYIVNDVAPGNARISNDGFIETQGQQSAGIFVAPLYEEIPLYQEVRINNGEVGSIITNGQDAQGILAYAGDLQILNGGVIETREANSAGIEAIGLSSISVINWGVGRISTQGLTFSPGIAVGGAAPVSGSTVYNNGHIATIGADSPGIVVLGGKYGDNHIVTSSCGDGVSCSITTTGDGSAGIQLGLVLDVGDPEIDIDAPSTGGEVYNGGIISTQGFFAPGIETLGMSNEVTNNSAASISTTGDGSPGINLNGNVSAGWNFGDIETHGAASPGMQVIGADGLVRNYGRIETVRPDSDGIVINGYDSEAENFGIIITVGSSSPGIAVAGDYSVVRNHERIETTGTRSDGIDLAGQYSVASNRDRIVTWGDNAYGMDLKMREGSATNTGSIETIGINSHGMLYQASYLDPLNNIYNSGGISTAGDGAHGIYALYSTYAIDNYGGISTAGDGAHGIRMRSIEATEPVLPVTTLFNNGDIYVGGAGSIGVSIERKLFEETTLENTVSGTISSAGVAIAGGDGFENVINRGIINGDILLGGALDTIINDGVINGNVDLGETGDDYYRGAGSAVNGIVDAGEGGEEFRDDILTLLTVSGNEVVDGSRYINFEQTLVGGAGALTLNGTLNTDLTTIAGVTLNVAGRLESLVSTVDGGGVKVIDGGLLGGNGTVGADVELLPGGMANSGESIGSLTIEGDLFLNGGILEFEVDSLFDKDELFVGGDAIFSEGFIDVFLGFVPAPEDVLEFLVVQGTIDILEGFGGIRGIATAGSGVPLGTEFTVALGEEIYQGIVTSAVPVPPSVWLFGSGLLGLVGIARRKRAA